MNIVSEEAKYSMFMIFILFFSLGKCMSLKACYPYFKIPEFNTLDTWVMGLYDTCSYQSPQGRQVRELQRILKPGVENILLSNNNLCSFMIIDLVNQQKLICFHRPSHILTHYLINFQSRIKVYSVLIRKSPKHEQMVKVHRMPEMGSSPYTWIVVDKTLWNPLHN